MKAIDVRNWLGIYFLSATLAIGGYILLFGGGPLLPFKREDTTAAFQIIVPVLIGQLSIIVRWFTTEKPPDPDSTVNIPGWLVKGPALGVLALLCLAIILKALSTYSIQHGGQEFVNLVGEDFKVLVTFCVSVLNATTIYVVGALFSAIKKDADAGAVGGLSLPKRE
jgi:hypothetical protein